MNDTDQLDARLRDALRATGEAAPPLRLPERLDMQLSPPSEPRKRRTLIPVLGIALAVAVISIGVAMATGSSAPQPEPRKHASPAGSPTASQSGVISLAAVEGWSVRDVKSCSDIGEFTDRVVFEIQSFDLACLRKVDRVGTRVFSMPEPDELLGQPLSQATTPWELPTSGRHELRRLTGGRLAAISSAYVDGVACVDCDRLFVVMGPVPDEVRAIVESVR